MDGGSEETTAFCFFWLALSILDGLNLVMMIPRRKRIIDGHKCSWLEHTRRSSNGTKRIDMNYDFLHKQLTTFPEPAEQSLDRKSVV